MIGGHARSSRCSTDTSASGTSFPLASWDFSNVHAPGCRYTDGTTRDLGTFTVTPSRARRALGRSGAATQALPYRFRVGMRTRAAWEIVRPELSAEAGNDWVLGTPGRRGASRDERQRPVTDVRCESSLTPMTGDMRRSAQWQLGSMAHGVSSDTQVEPSVPQSTVDGEC